MSLNSQGVKNGLTLMDRRKYASLRACCRWLLTETSLLRQKFSISALVTVFFDPLHLCARQMANENQSNGDPMEIEVLLETISQSMQVHGSH